MIPPMAAILAWPLVATVLFGRFRLAHAICLTIIAGYLFLPAQTRYNLPLLPALDKNTMPAFAAIILSMIYLRLKGSDTRIFGTGAGGDVLPGWIPRSPVALVLIAMVLGGSFLTVLTNGDRLVYGQLIIPGLRPYDAFSGALTSLMAFLPLLLARKFIATDEAHRALLYALLVLGVIYSLPTLYEVRMSPQLNKQVYGFFGSSWQQHLRDDGFRPVVFLRHGLWLGIFLSCSAIATIVLLRLAEPSRRAKFLFCALWLLVTLILAKTLTALIIFCVIAPLVLFLKARVQLLIAAVIAGVVLLYPMLRGADLVPVDRIINIANQYDDKRGSSLQFRFNNEDILLAKAQQRPAFGWGGWGRARVYDDRGRDISVTDGRWVISIGENGWIGYIGSFGLLTIPIMILAFRSRRYNVSLATAGVGLVLAGNLIDLIPNAGLTPVTWLMAGALLGRLEYKHAGASETGRQTASARPARAGGGRRRGARGGTVPQGAAAPSPPLTAERGTKVRYSRFPHVSKTPQK